MLDWLQLVLGWKGKRMISFPYFRLTRCRFDSFSIFKVTVSQKVPHSTLARRQQKGSLAMLSKRFREH